MNENSPLKQIEAHLAKGKYSDARDLARQLKGPLATRLAILGTVSLKEGNKEEAIAYFERALKEDPTDTLAQINFGKLLVSSKRSKEAVEMLENVYKKETKENVALALAAAYVELDKMGQAIDLLQPYLSKDKPSLMLLLSASSILRANLQPKESLAILERAKSLYQDAPELRKALADAYAELDPLAAVQMFRELSDESESKKWNQSFAELRVGNFEVGWTLYDAGLSDKIGRIGRPLPMQVKGLPLITDFASTNPKKYLVITTEQGIGDQVLFLSTFREARERHKNLVMVCENRMLPLLKRSYEGLECYPYSLTGALLRHQNLIEGILPIGSLMKTFRPQPADFDKTKFPYLMPNPELVQRYKQLLANKFSNKPIIGLSWSGGYWDRQIRSKSLSFDDVLSLASRNPHLQFVSLQYGNTEVEHGRAAREAKNITFFKGIDFKKDLENWLALAHATDHILSVSTALVHFMGAMSKGVTLILTDYQSPFIWGTDEGPSLPYPSVHRIRKQPGESREQFETRLGIVVNDAI